MNSEIFDQRKEAFEKLVNDCKEAVKIYDMVSSVVDLKRKGANHVGACPFHNEKSPSFTVSEVRNSFCCFGCGTKGDAIKFVMDFHKLDFIKAIEFVAKYYRISDEREQLSHAPKQAKPLPQIAPKLPKTDVNPCVYIPIETVQKTLKMYDNNHFAHFLVNTFGEAIATALLLKFKIGTSKKWNGASIFWYWNHKGATAGKIMLYNPNTGKRDKFKIGSVFSEMKLQKPSNGLFGDWQLEGNNKVVAIVESEKTAICMSVILPNFCWVATGGKSNLDFKKDEYDILIGQKIVLIPDVNGLLDWQKQCEIALEYGFDVSIYNGLNGLNLDANEDVLDVALRENWHKSQNGQSITAQPIEMPQTVMFSDEPISNIWNAAFDELVTISKPPLTTNYDLTVNDRKGIAPF